MKIAVIGASGQLGSDVVEAFADNSDSVSPLNHDQIEVSNLESVKACLETVSPIVVVNTAAMHHVENCERDPAAAYAVNAVGVRNLAMVASALGATLIHISTDYVFDGNQAAPYVEDDAPSP